jgi:hypothetical protein
VGLAEVFGDFLGGRGVGAVGRHSAGDEGRRC